MDMSGKIWSFPASIKSSVRFSMTQGSTLTYMKPWYGSCQRVGMHSILEPYELLCQSNRNGWEKEQRNPRIKSDHRLEQAISLARDLPLGGQFFAAATGTGKAGWQNTASAEPTAQALQRLNPSSLLLRCHCKLSDRSARCESERARPGSCEESCFYWLPRVRMFVGARRNSTRLTRENEPFFLRVFGRGLSVGEHNSGMFTFRIRTCIPAWIGQTK